MKIFGFSVLLLISAMLTFTACDLNGGSGGVDDGGATPISFDSADTPGDTVTVTAGSVTADMVYANNQESITFPTNSWDNWTHELKHKFFMAETADRIIRGGGWAYSAYTLEVGECGADYPYVETENVGFRFARTQ